MKFDYTTTFSLIEWLAVTGLIQSVFILVFIVFNARNWRQASIALAYFLFLAASFGLQFALRLEDFEGPIRLALWVSREMGAPLCYLLVLQVVKLTDLPERRHFLILLVLPAVAIGVFLLGQARNFCDEGGWRCQRVMDILYWIGSMASALCMLALWAHKDIFGKLRRLRGGRERYWLVITLVAANVLRVVVSLLLATGHLTMRDSDALQVTLGIALAYLATTTLFRVYPLPVPLNAASRARTMLFSDEERKIAEKVQKLMELDKVYHEPEFSRADLAREVGTSENTLSRVINRAFGKSFPKLLNELRVEDAKRMLHDPAIPIQVLAFEVGFNSLASFNRVFREVTGETPSEYRSSHKIDESKS
ncbi:MAG: AraC family transcriptional regulator [Alphaproteobacteria bacterium]|nr:MAG: AraC family transcriptional regulator [Alphaproteobacteria bacterium]